MEGSVSARTVVVGGAVKGDISCTEKLVILSSGLMLGNVRSPRLIVEEGVIVNGECRISGDREIPLDTPDTAVYQPFEAARK